MKKIIFILSIISSSICFSQSECEALKIENVKLKKQLSTFIDTSHQISIKSFSPNFNVNIVKVSGNKDAQTVDVEFIISHSMVHQEVCLNIGPEETKIYDNSGNVYDTRSGQIGMKSCLNSGSSKIMNSSYSCEKIPTDIPVKAKITVRKIMANTDELQLVNIKIGYRDFEGNLVYQYGYLEIKNLKIQWN